MAKKFGSLSAISDALSGGFAPAALDAPFMVPLSALAESSQQLRIDMADVEALAASMLSVGLLQPISVSADGKGGYTVVAGHRRVAAARLLGWESIPAYRVAFQGDGELSIKGLVENIQRSDLSPLELALAVDRAMAVSKLKPSEFARAIGKDAAWLSKVRSILTLPPAVLDALALSMTPAERRRLGLEALAQLSRLEDEELCIRLFEQLRSGELSREGMREAIRAHKKPSVSKTTVSLPAVTVADLPSCHALDKLEPKPLELPESKEPTPHASETITQPEGSPLEAPQTPKIGAFARLSISESSGTAYFDFSAFTASQIDSFLAELEALCAKYSSKNRDKKAHF